MKNKGVFLTILLILVLGIGITASIHRFVTGQIGSLRAGDVRATASELFAVPEENLLVLAEDASETGSGQERRTARTAAGTQEEMGRSRMRRMEGEQPEMEGTIAVTTETELAAQAETKAEGPSVLTDARSGEAGYYLVEELVTYEDFQKKLREADQSMEELRTSGSVSNTTDSMKRTADYEYRLWDTERNRIYTAVLNRMSEKEAERFRSEERTWIRNRDQTARQAAEKFSGGTMESLEYTASLSASTRARAYEILEEYGHLLP